MVGAHSSSNALAIVSNLPTRMNHGEESVEGGPLLAEDSSGLGHFLFKQPYENNNVMPAIPTNDRVLSTFEDESQLWSEWCRVMGYISECQHDQPKHLQGLSVATGLPGLTTVWHNSYQHSCYRHSCHLHNLFWHSPFRHSSCESERLIPHLKIGLRHFLHGLKHFCLSLMQQWCISPLLPTKEGTKVLSVIDIGTMPSVARGDVPKRTKAARPWSPLQMVLPVVPLIPIAIQVSGDKLRQWSGSSDSNLQLMLHLMNCQSVWFIPTWDVRMMRLVPTIQSGLHWREC